MPKTLYGKMSEKMTFLHVSKKFVYCYEFNYLNNSIINLYFNILF